MKSTLLSLLALALTTTRLLGAEAPARVHELAQNEFKALAADPVVVAAIAAQNAKRVPLDEIKKFDERWIATAGTADFMRPYLDSPAGDHLRAWRKGRAFVAEIIVMDNQGANVAVTEKTSDFWQGDEKKFSETFKEGGKTFVDKMKFDDSTQTYSVQVSVPVVDASGALIGAICFTVDIENL